MTDNICPGCGAADCTPATCPAYVEATAAASAKMRVTDRMVNLACLAYGPGAFPHRMRAALEAVCPETGR